MYLIDSNILINASRQYYAPDLAPKFWDWMSEQAELGNIASVSQVRQELNRGDPRDFLQNWSKQLPSSFWHEPLVSAATSFQPIFDWVSHPDRPYLSAAVTEFFNVADSSLVAQAHSHGWVVVTFEVSTPQAKKKVSIPDVCDALDVEYCDGFDMYRSLGLTFT